jgi:excisionase family DNA binding protein
MPYIAGVKYLTIAEASRALGVPRAHVLAAIRDKKLPAYWHRYRLYVLPLDLDRYLEHLNNSVDAVAAKLLKACGVRARLIMTSETPKIRELVARLSGQEPPSKPLALLEFYRATLERWWELTAQGSAADLAEVSRTFQEILRFIDEVGEPPATRLRREWAREWHQRTGVCPFCGERGPYHDPDQEGGAA